MHAAKNAVPFVPEPTIIDVVAMYDLPSYPLSCRTEYVLYGHHILVVVGITSVAREPHNNTQPC